MPSSSALDFIRRIKRREKKEAAARNDLAMSMSTLSPPRPRSAMNMTESEDKFGGPQGAASSFRNNLHLTQYERCHVMQLELRRLQEEVPRLCRHVALPHIDYELLVRDHVESLATHEVESLQELHKALTQLDFCRETALSHVAERERLMGLIRASCVATATVACTREGHAMLLANIHSVDIVTTEIVRAVRTWRTHLNMPLPFMFRNNNYLLRLVEEASLLKRVVVHLTTQARGETDDLPRCMWATARHVLSSDKKSLAVVHELSQEVYIVCTELSRQKDWVRAALERASRGMYVPVLRFHGRAPIFLESHQRKRFLVSCLTSAQSMLDQQANGPQTATFDFRTLAHDLASCTHRLSREHSWNAWFQYAMLRKAQKAAVTRLYEKILIHYGISRFGTWRVNAQERAVQRSEDLRRRILRSQVTYRRYLKKWFNYRCLKALLMQCRRTLQQRYFHWLLFARNRRIADGIPENARGVWLVAASSSRTVPHHLQSIIDFQSDFRPRVTMTLAEEKARVAMCVHFVQDVMSLYVSAYQLLFDDVLQRCVDELYLAYSKLIQDEEHAEYVVLVENYETLLVSVEVLELPPIEATHGHNMLTIDVDLLDLSATIDLYSLSSSSVV